MVEAIIVPVTREAVPEKMAQIDFALSMSYYCIATLVDQVQCSDDPENIDAVMQTVREIQLARETIAPSSPKSSPHRSSMPEGWGVPVEPTESKMANPRRRPHRVKVLLDGQWRWIEAAEGEH